VKSLKYPTSAILFVSLLFGCSGGDSSSGLDQSRTEITEESEELTVDEPSTPITEESEALTVAEPSTEIVDEDEELFVDERNLVKQTASSFKVTTPNGGQKWTTGKSYAIKWTKGKAGATVKIQLLKSNKHYKWISKKTKNDGKLVWKIPSTVVTSSAYKIKITSTTKKTVTDSSNKTFNITKAAGGGGSSLKVTAPNGGQKWTTGKTYQIKWSKGNAGAKVKILLLKNGKAHKWIAKSTKNDGKHVWKIPANIATASTYKIKITSTTKKKVTDSSNSSFTITKTGGGGGTPKVTLSCTPSSFSETSGKATCTLRLSKSTTKSVKVKLGYSGTATEGTDYSGNHTSRTISAGKTSTSWTLTGKSDTKREGNETIVINVTSVTNATEKGIQKASLVLTNSSTSLKITGPKAGDSLWAQDDITVTWTPGDSDYLLVTLLKSGKVIAESKEDARDLEETFSLDLCDDAPGGDYQIKIREVNKYGGSIPGGKEVNSGRFTMKWPSVKLLYPKGGETLTLDKWYDIKIDVKGWRGKVYFDVWLPNYEDYLNCNAPGCWSRWNTPGFWGHSFDEDGQYNIGTKWSSGTFDPIGNNRLRVIVGVAGFRSDDEWEECWSKNFPGIASGYFSLTE